MRWSTSLPAYCMFLLINGKGSSSLPFWVGCHRVSCGYCSARDCRSFFMIHCIAFIAAIQAGWPQGWHCVHSLHQRLFSSSTCFGFKAVCRISLLCFCAVVSLILSGSCHMLWPIWASVQSVDHVIATVVALQSGRPHSWHCVHALRHGLFFQDLFPRSCVASRLRLKGGHHARQGISTP